MLYLTSGMMIARPFHEQTSWGGASLVDAAKVLLRAALKDRTNQQFLLLSESCAMPALLSRLACSHVPCV